MYIPAPFAETRTDVLHVLVREHPFATLVTTDGAGVPVATHLPLLLDADRGPNGVLLGHFAKGNEQVAALGIGRAAMAVFHGPHAYVSPRWYETSPAVPTWNYSAVHAYGVVRRIDDPAELRALLDRTAAAFEPAVGGWTADGLSEAYLRSMTAGIVGFVFEIERLEGKFKLSQNRPAADRAGVIANLSLGMPEDKAVAAAMSERERPA